MKIVQRIPNFVSYRGRTPTSSGSFEKIMKVKWVASWKSDTLDGHPFRRYSRKNDALIAEFGTIEQEGEEFPAKWWVVGLVSDPDEGFNALPEARFPKRD